MTRRALSLVAALCLAWPAAAHDGEVHEDAGDARRHAAETSAAPVGPDTAFPIDVGGAFSLTDQTGAARSERDPDGRMQLLFFGYANCPSICSVALPTMASATDILAADGIAVRPVMVTVDPQRDTPATIGPPLARHHPDFVGLTGSKAELAAVYDLFSVEKTIVFEDPEHGPVYAHGSFIYLLDAGGGFLTLMPPILSPERIAEIVESYATG